jgi:hypothetical protein
MASGTNYPKWIYFKTTSGVESRLVQSPEELKSLGDGWAESPAGPFSTPKRVIPKIKKRR